MILPKIVSCTAAGASTPTSTCVDIDCSGGATNEEDTAARARVNGRGQNRDDTESITADAEVEACKREREGAEIE